MTAGVVVDEACGGNESTDWSVSQGSFRLRRTVRQTLRQTEVIPVKRFVRRVARRLARRFKVPSHGSYEELKKTFTFTLRSTVG